MNSDVTVRDVMRREYVGASEADTLVDTAALMLEEEVEAVVVLRGSEPVGVLTERDLLEAAVDQGDLDSMTVEHAMQKDPQSVTPETSLATATDLMSGESTRRVLVMDGEEPVGVITEQDIVTASTLNPGANSELGQTAQTETMTTEAVTATAQGTATDEEFSSQGICELCGSLTRNLSTFNGQLVCSDCKDV